MPAYNEAYLDEVVETQGKLFAYIAYDFPDMDTKDFIESYMKSKTRHYIDVSQAYVSTKNYLELFEYFCEVDRYQLKKGKALGVFIPDWIGRFYAYYQWKYDLPSAELLKIVPLDFLKRSFYGLQDLEIELAAARVHDHLKEQK